MLTFIEAVQMRNEERQNMGKVPFWSEKVLAACFFHSGVTFGATCIPKSRHLIQFSSVRY